MSPNYDNELEARIDRELKSLPPLAAPRTLAPRVMAALASRAVEPWYRRAWQTWPMPLRAASLAVLLAMFGGLCFGGLQVSQSPGVTVATEKASGALAIVNLICNTASVLGDAAMQAIQHLNPLVVFWLIVAAVSGYALLLGISAAGYRLAFARR